MSKPDGLIISAGFSSRMQQFKPLMLYENTPFLLSIMVKMARVCSNIFVVTGYQSQEIMATAMNWFKLAYKKEWFDQFLLSENLWKEIPSRIQFIFNPKFERGMFGSLQVGLKIMVKKNWILYHFVDQPHIPPTFYQEFIERISSESDWIQPGYRNKRGHPILFNQKVRNLVLQANISENLKTISGKELIRKRSWNCSYHQVIENFNTKNDMKNFEGTHEYF
jgi:molybdenum cofactor cytidylyltransferase